MTLLMCDPYLSPMCRRLEEKARELKIGDNLDGFYTCDMFMSEGFKLDRRSNQQVIVYDG